MIENSGDRPNGLGEFEAAHLDANMQIMFGAVSEGLSNEQAERLKLIARDKIVGLLIDPMLGERVADRLIDDHLNPEIETPEYSLYVYWSILKRASEVAKDSRLPLRFIDFAERLAEDWGETDIVYKLIEIKAGIPEDEENEANEQEEARFEPVLAQVALLNSIAAQTKEALTLKNLASQATMSNLDSPAHLADRQRLMHRDGHPSDLLEDIQNSRFVTKVGLDAAKVQQDADRLIMRAGRPTALFEDIQNNRFTTREGLAAAMAQQDSERLRIRSGHPSALFDDIQERRLITKEGMLAAMAQQDSERLRIRSGHPSALLDDIKNSYFTTPEGVARAMAQQDADRLVLRHGSPSALLEDIKNRRFITPEGVARAMALQDADRLEMYSNRPSLLRENLLQNKFLTPNGIATAKRILGLQ